MRKNLQLWSAGGRPAGQMLAFNPTTTCGFRACGKVNGGTGAMSGEASLFVKATGKGADWVLNMPNRVRLQGMALAPTRLYVAGLLADGNSKSTENVVRAYALSDGKLLAEYRIGEPMVHDCLAIAGDRLYVSLQTGKLICLGKQ